MAHNLAINSRDFSATLCIFLEPGQEGHRFPSVAADSQHAEGRQLVNGRVICMLLQESTDDDDGVVRHRVTEEVTGCNRHDRTNLWLLKTISCIGTERLKIICSINLENKIGNFYKYWRETQWVRLWSSCWTTCPKWVSRGPLHCTTDEGQTRRPREMQACGSFRWLRCSEALIHIWIRKWVRDQNGITKRLQMQMQFS